MNRAWYAFIFALAVVVLTVGGIISFRRLDSVANGALPGDIVFSAQDSSALRSFNPIAPSPRDYARYEADDASWRARNARQFSLAELRARGDGRRTPRQQLQDRVYEFTRRGDKAGAIRELERWVASNPRDPYALLWLARLLNETGRKTESVARYRQLLAAKQGNPR
jgi:tetratricopeptide repeat protein